MSYSKAKFGTLDWAVQKIMEEALLQGSPADVTKDCHKRAGKFLHQISMTNSQSRKQDISLDIYSLPHGMIAHTGIKIDNRLLSDPMDQDVIRKIDEYKKVVSIDSKEIEPFIVIFSGKDIMRSSELDVLDNILISPLRNGDSGYGFFKNKTVSSERKVLESLIAAEMLDITTDTHEEIRVSLNEKGQKGLISFLALCSSAKMISHEEYACRRAIVEKTAAPVNMMRSNPLKEDKWVRLDDSMEIWKSAISNDEFTDLRKEMEWIQNSIGMETIEATAEIEHSRHQKG